MLAIHMTKDRAAAQSLLTQCQNWLRFYHQRWQNRRLRKVMMAHITRVASLSPHLLRDMGFEDVTNQVTPHLTILRKGSLTVSIQSSPRGAEQIITVSQGTEDTIDKSRV